VARRSTLALGVVVTSLSVLVVIAVVGGVVVGEVGGFALGKVLFRAGSGRPELAAHVARAARNGGILASIVGFICSFWVGGNLGGSAGAALFGAVGVPIGIFLGISLILCAVVSAGYVIAGKLCQATLAGYDA
jgi:hypothetical protein